MKIIRCITGLVFLCTLLMVPSCIKSPVTVHLGNWIRRADFPGAPRGGAFCFAIGNVAYIGTGYHGSVGATYVNDCYSFDSNGTVWNNIAPFPGTPRERSVAFSIGGKGYVGTGYNRDADSTHAPLKDFWEYNPATNQWKQLNDFAGGARYSAVAFASSQFGYVGTGFNGSCFGDFWRYDPAGDSWTQIPSYQGEQCQEATAIAIDGKFYLLSGYTNNNFFFNDIWRFDPDESANLAWKNVTPLLPDPQYGNYKTASRRIDAVGFGLNGMGYIATGNTGSITNTIYQYDPVRLTWTKMTSFEGPPRSQAIAFVVGGRAYVGTGQNDGTRFDDMMEFLPLAD